MLLISNSSIRPFLAFHDFPHASVAQTHLKHSIEHGCTSMMPASTSRLLHEKEPPIARRSHCHSYGQTRVGSLRAWPVAHPHRHHRHHLPPLSTSLMMDLYHIGK